MKETVARLTPEQWSTLIHTAEYALTATIAALGAVICNIIVAWRTGEKIERHDARATARAREKGEVANPQVRAEDRGHV